MKEKYSLSCLDQYIFSKDENGQDIFYLWGAFGEALYVNKKQKTKIFIALIAYIVFVLLSISSLIYLDAQKMVSSNDLSYVAGFVFMSFSLVYFFSVSLFAERKDLTVILNVSNDLRKKHRHSERDLRMALFATIILQIPAIMSAIEDQFVTFIALSITYILLVLYFVLRLHKTKGCYFSGK